MAKLPYQDPYLPCGCSASDVPGYDDGPSIPCPSCKGSGEDADEDGICSCSCCEGKGGFEEIGEVWAKIRDGWKLWEILREHYKDYPRKSRAKHAKGHIIHRKKPS